MNDYHESFSFLLSFLRDYNTKKLDAIQVPDEELARYFSHDPDFVNKVVNQACFLNKRIQSERVSEALEEITSVMEVTR